MSDLFSTKPSPVTTNSTNTQSSQVRREGSPFLGSFNGPLIEQTFWSTLYLEINVVSFYVTFSSSSFLNAKASLTDLFPCIAGPFGLVFFLDFSNICMGLFHFFARSDYIFSYAFRKVVVDWAPYLILRHPPQNNQERRKKTENIISIIYILQKC